VWIIPDIPFRVGAMRFGVTQISIAALDGAAHQHNAPKLSKGRGIRANESAYVHQRTHTHQRYLPRVAPNLIENERNRLRVGSSPEAAAFGVASLAKRGFCIRRHTLGHRDVLPAGLA